MIQKNIIKNLLRDRGTWVPSWDIQKIATRWGWLGTSADRQARLMAEEGEIEREQRGKYVFYRLKGLKEFAKPDQEWRKELKKKLLKQMEEEGQGKLNV